MSYPVAIHKKKDGTYDVMTNGYFWRKFKTKQEAKEGIAMLRKNNPDYALKSKSKKRDSSNIFTAVFLNK